MNTQESIEPEHRIKVLLNTMLEIADRRASLSKGVMRLDEVIEIYLEKAQSDPDGYQEIMGYLRKATFGTKDAEIAELATSKKSLSRDQWKKKAMEHIRQKVKIFQEHEAQVEQGYSEIINEIADIGMEESS